MALLAASAPGITTANAGGQPPHPDWQTDTESCTWSWQEGGGLGLWAETCTLSTGLWRVIWDDTRGAFVERRDADITRVVVQPFALAPGEGVDALTDRLFAAGHLAQDATCRWESQPVRPAPRTMAFFVLTPADPDALRPTNEGDVPEPVSGPYGVSTHGVRYFITDLRWPHLATFVDAGQERAMFDPASIVRP